MNQIPTRRSFLKKTTALALSTSALFSGLAFAATDECSHIGRTDGCDKNPNYGLGFGLLFCDRCDNPDYVLHCDNGGNALQCIKRSLVGL